jgi:hypothetical protein
MAEQSDRARQDTAGRAIDGISSGRICVFAYAWDMG